jgi:glycosyltransferase involved in cell wall biosynthesis
MTGGDLAMWEYARYLAAQGHEVECAVSSFSDAPPVAVKDGIRVVRLGRLHLLWWHSCRHYFRTARGRVDLVVTEGFGGSRIPRLCPLYVREPVITEWHQIHRELFAVQYPRLVQPFLNGLERVAAFVHRDTLLRAGTDDWARRFPDIGFRPERIVTVPVSIPESWLGKEPEPLAARDHRIVWLGKLRRYKCPDHVIRALPAVLAHVPDAELVIALRRDDLRYEEELRRTAKRLGVSDHVTFLVNIGDEAKQQLLARCRAMVVPSSVEGFGIVVLEANACGTPVVASSGVPDGSVRHGSTGLKHAFGDIDSIARLLTVLLTDDTLWNRLSRNAVDFASSFSWAACGARFEAVALAAAWRWPAASLETAAAAEA